MRKVRVYVYALAVIVSVLIAVFAISSRPFPVLHHAHLANERTQPPATLEQTTPHCDRLPPPMTEHQCKLIGLTKEDIDGIEKFVMFVGYTRSGHSIIGSLMDAHPNMIIAHQFGLFRQWQNQSYHDKLNGNRRQLYKILYQESCTALTEGARSEDSDIKGYTLNVNNSWQGQFEQLKVIGDKSGDMAGQYYYKNASRTRKSYQEMVETVEVPVYSLHVVRNPFDIISTQVLYHTSGLGYVKKAGSIKYEPPNGSKYNNMILLENKIVKFFHIAKAVRDMISTCNLNVLEIHSEDLIANPKESMKRICDFLGVECSPCYLQMCKDKVFPKISRTRDKVEWSEEQKAHVQRLMKDFSFFKGYNFVDDHC